MGPCGLAHRDLQDERRRAPRLTQGYVGEDHRWQPSIPNPRNPAQELRPGVKLKTKVVRLQRVWMPLVTQAFSSVGSVHAVRHCRVSGLSMRQVTRRRPSWRCAGRAHNAYASSMALRCGLVFPIPSRLTICPCLSSVLPESRQRPVRPPSGSGGSPVTLLLRHQRPYDARHPVGQRHGDQHVRLAHQHPGKPWVVCPTAPSRPANDHYGARNQEPPQVALAHLRYLAQPQLAARCVLTQQDLCRVKAGQEHQNAI